MFLKSPAVIFYPLALVWSALYGAVGGALYKLLALHENWTDVNRQLLIRWKKYPQRSYRQYISRLCLLELRGKPLEWAGYLQQKIERQHPSQPFPLLNMAVNTLTMLVLAPAMIFLGALKGPVYVFRKLCTRRLRLLLEAGNRQSARSVPGG